ncbi:MAG: YbgC/FadM family acyl-CoA thioesterase [Bacteroidetes bacterium]|nr:YbgC/FadM family acyl-CoA thioesterase [Bacteroidota bacterium]
MLRVRYGETDRMGFLFHAHYVNYYEVARTESIRQLGLTYRSIEDEGIIMPVTDVMVKYLLPAHYDELITIHSTIAKLPEVRMVINAEMLNESGQVINRSEVKLAFLNAASKHICRAPESLLNAFRPFFASESAS